MANQKNTMTISVVIPAYNSEKYLRRSLDSVFAQTRLPDEVIVVDDGSSDNTAQVAAGFSDKIIFIQQENAGASAARNAGIKAAKSNWIAFLDADDEWLPKYLESQIQLLSSNPKLGWSTGNYYTRLASSPKQSAWNDIATVEKKLRGKLYFEDFFLMSAQDINGHTNSTIVKKQVLIDVGLFSIEQKKANDLDLWWRIAYKYPEIGFLCEPSSIYYLEIQESITSSNSDHKFYVKLLLKHIGLANDAQRIKPFKEFLNFRISRWARSMLFDQRCSEVRNFLINFSDILPLRKRIIFWIVTIRPNFTRRLLLLMSKIVRKLGVRKRLVKAAK